VDALLAHRPQNSVPSVLEPDLPTAANLVAEAHHRVANSLALLISMVRMQAASLKKETGPLRRGRSPSPDRFFVNTASR